MQELLERWELEWDMRLQRVSYMDIRDRREEREREWEGMKTVVDRLRVVVAVVVPLQLHLLLFPLFRVLLLLPRTKKLLLLLAILHSVFPLWSLKSLFVIIFPFSSLFSTIVEFIMG